MAYRAPTTNTPKMNTPQSMAVGWGALLFAGGISFYWAKKEIHARRKMQRDAGIRPTEQLNWYDRLDPKPASLSQPSNPSSQGTANTPSNQNPKNG